MARKLDVDSLLEAVFRNPDWDLLHKAFSRLMSEKLRFQRERLIFREAIKYEQGLGTLEVSWQPVRLWWKDN